MAADTANVLSIGIEFSQVRACKTGLVRASGAAGRLVFGPDRHCNEINLVGGEKIAFKSDRAVMET